MPARTVRATPSALSSRVVKPLNYAATPTLLAIPVNRPRLFPADKGYDGDEVRNSLMMRGIQPVIPPKAIRKNPPACNFKAYKDRNRIERIFNKQK